MRTISITTKNILSPEDVEMLRKVAEMNANDNKQEFIKMMKNHNHQPTIDGKILLNEGEQGLSKGNRISEEQDREEENQLQEEG